MVPSLSELMRMKENQVNPLNYNCEFSRLTTLFQRPLQIKYYAKKPVKPEGADASSAANKQAEAAKYVTEDGDILEDMMPEPAADQPGGDMDDGAPPAREEYEAGFEEANLEDAHGFGNYSAEK